MNLHTLRKKVMDAGVLRSACLAALGFFSISSLSAATIVTDFSNVSNLTPYGSSVSFDNHGGAGPLTVTVNETSSGVWGVFGGKGVFTWSQWLSLDKENDQYAFVLTGAQSVGSQSANIVDVAFIVGGVGTVTTGPITPVDGTWSFDVYEAVSQLYYSGGEVAENKSFQVQIYVGPASGSSGQGIVYEFGSFAAIPEPSTGILLGAGLAFACFYRNQKRGLRSS